MSPWIKRWVLACHSDSVCDSHASGQVAQVLCLLRTWKKEEYTHNKGPQNLCNLSGRRVCLDTAIPMGPYTGLYRRLQAVVRGRCIGRSRCSHAATGRVRSLAGQVQLQGVQA